MRKKDIIIAISLAIMVMAISSALYVGRFIVITPPYKTRDLAKSFLKYSYNPWNEELTSYALNVVSAIIWDYRGLDTILETAVLYSAIIGITTLFRGVIEIRGLRHRGLSFLVKMPSRIIIPLIIAVGISLAMYGHLTPGGGFQAGAVATVAPALIITIFSIETLYALKFRTRKLFLIRTIAFAGILVISISLFLYSLVFLTNAYILQNMIRENSNALMPHWFVDVPLAGSIFFYNILEFLTVFAGLTYVFIIYSMREREVESMWREVETYE